jgi:heme/copper-type cytochrome/quinol oxidase subunit 4
MSAPSPATPAHAESAPVNLRKAFLVFGTQLLITVMLVTAYYLPWGNTTGNLIFTAILALCQAALVLCFSMHFISERGFIYGVALFTVIFLAVMFYLILTATDPSHRLRLSYVA